MEQQAACDAPLHLITACVGSDADSRMSGRNDHRFGKQSIPFLKAEEVLFSIENLMDEWDYAQSTLKMRSFAGVLHHRRSQPGMARKAINDPLAYTGQGTVTWADKNKQQNFRSALELIKPMDSAWSHLLSVARWRCSSGHCGDRGHRVGDQPPQER